MASRPAASNPQHTPVKTRNGGALQTGVFTRYFTRR